MNGLIFEPSKHGDVGNSWVEHTQQVLKDQQATCIVEGRKVDTCCNPGTLDETGKNIRPGKGCFCRLDTMGDAAEQTPFFSVFVSMWWVLTTITTVGYGDTFPTTLMGRIIGAVAMILGVVGFAMPISIIGNAFEEEYNRLSTQPRLVDEALGIGSGEDISTHEVTINGNQYVRKEDDETTAQLDTPGVNETSNRVTRIPTTMVSREPQYVLKVLANIAKDMGVTKEEWSSFAPNTTAIQRVDA